MAEAPEKQPENGRDVGSEGRGQKPAEGANFIFVMTVIALVLSMFLVSLDMTIVATAIPSITDEFKGIDLVGWYGSAFFLTLGSFQSSWGKMYTYFPLKPAVLVSIVVFEVGSLICGVAKNSVTLIVGRAVTGLGGAGISSGAFTIIALSAPPRQRPAFTGILGASYGIASAVGPLLGGVFTSHVSWRWCFYINLPIGGVAGVIILIFYKAPPPLPFLKETLREKLLQMDFLGVLFLMGAVVCYILALQWGGVTKSWSDSSVIGTLIGCAVLGLCFAAIQWRQGERAAIIGRILKNRTVVIAMVFIDLLAGTFFVLVYYLPVYFQVVSGVSAAASGIRNLPLILSQTVATILSGILITKIGYATPFLLGGAALTVVGSGLIYILDIGSSAGSWISFQIVAGAGVGLCFQVPLITAQAAVPPKDLPSVTAMVLTVQTLGGAFFISAAQSAFTNVLVKTLPTAAPSVDPSTVVLTGATELRDVFTGEQIPGLMVAYMQGLKTAFIIAIVASGVATTVGLGSRWRKLPTPDTTVIVA